MPYFQKIFDLHLNALFANAFVQALVFHRLLAVVVRTCHNYVRAAAHQAYRLVRPQIHWATIAIKRLTVVMVDDGRLPLALVQHLVQGQADKIHYDRKCTKFAIRWSWNHQRTRMVDVGHDQTMR